MEERIQALWRERFHWFAAQFVVVLAGVLVALTVQAWYQRTQDLRRENAYLMQIDDELRITEQDLVAQIAYADTLIVRGNTALSSFFQPEPPPLDSIEAWWTFDHAAPDLTLGTLRALTSNGDIRSIQSQRARAAIVWISEKARYYDERLRKWELIIVNTDAAHQPLRARLALMHAERGDTLGLVDPSTGGTRVLSGMDVVPSTRRKDPRFAPTLRAYFDDPAMYAAVRLYTSGNAAHRANMKRLLLDIRRARSEIKAADP